MKPKYIVFALIGVAVLFGLRFAITALEAPQESTVTAGDTLPRAETPAATTASSSSWQQPDEPAPLVAPAAEVASAETDELDVDPEQLIQQYGFSPEKIEALRAARDGDPRTPPIKRTQKRELPTPEELADPELYLQYEERQTKKFFAGFVKASDAKIKSIRDVIEEGKKHGISDEDLQAAEEKIQAIEEMRAQLLREDPSLLDDTSGNQQNQTPDFLAPTQ